MDKLLVLIYSHTSYIDILIPSLFNFKKYTKNIKYSLLINDDHEIKSKYNNEFNFEYIYIYNDNTPYFSRINNCLKNILEPYVLLNHENNIMIDFLNEDYLSHIILTMENNNIDMVRLSSSGINNTQIESSASSLINLNKISNSGERLYFTVQPTIHKKNVLLSLTAEFIYATYFSSEDQLIEEYVKNNYITYFINIPAHSYNYIYPVCKVTNYAKWFNYNDFTTTHITNIINKYNSDITKRGMLNN